MGRFFVGTSGFSYPSWRGVFYPPHVAAGEYLSYYAQHFPALELNVTFYRWPRRQTCLGWRKAVGPHFRFVVKVHRSITHQKRLEGCKGELEKLVQLCESLDAACCLLQLPPSLPFSPELLEGFLAEIPPGLPPLVWEPRHRSFGTAEAVGFFAQRGLALAVPHSGGRFPEFRVFTAPPAYLRFHGPGPLYASSYSQEQLASFAQWVKHEVPPSVEVYAFFNNDVGGHAVANARQFAALLEGA